MKAFKCSFLLRCALVAYTLLSVIEPVGGRRRSRTHNSDVLDSDKKREKSNRRNKNQKTDFMNDEETYDSLDPDEIPNYSTNNEIETPEVTRRKKIDPKRSWMTFVRYTDDRATENKPDRRKKKRNRKNRSKKLYGPPGPPGPQGPPGPPGPSVSKEEILEELRELIAATAEKRAQEMFAEMPFGSGAFQRGDTFNTKEGRFVVPRDGVYQFSTSLHLRVRARRKQKSRTKDRDYLRVVICIDSLCKTNTSLETITGIDGENGTFTVRASGILELKENQYVSVYVDNSSTHKVSVLQGSEYSGIFMGV